MLNIHPITEVHGQLDAKAAAALATTGVIVLESDMQAYSEPDPVLAISSTSPLLHPNLAIDVLGNYWAHRYQANSLKCMEDLRSGFCPVSALTWLYILLISESAGYVDIHGMELDYLIAMPTVSIHDDKEMFGDYLFFTRLAHTYRPDLEVQLHTYVPVGPHIQQNKLTLRQGSTFLLDPNYVHNTELSSVNHGLSVADLGYPLAYEQILFNRDWIFDKEGAVQAENLEELSALWERAKVEERMSIKKWIETKSALDAGDSNVHDQFSKWRTTLPLALLDQLGLR